MTTLTCFKAYDIRGQLGAELNENIAYRIGRAYAQFLDAKRIVIGGDMRLSTAGLKQALANGLMDAGCDVIDLGMTGTEEVYFAAFHLDVDGGIEVTASHNPIDFNGMKLVRHSLQNGDASPAECQDGGVALADYLALFNPLAPPCRSTRPECRLLSDTRLEDNGLFLADSSAVSSLLP